MLESVWNLGECWKQKDCCYEKQLETHLNLHRSLATSPFQPGQMIGCLSSGKIELKGLWICWEVGGKYS